MVTDVEYRIKLNNAAALLGGFSQLRPCRVTFVFRNELVTDADDTTDVWECYDEQSQDRLLYWLDLGGEFDCIRSGTKSGYSFTRLIEEGEHWLAIGFPKKRDRGFVVMEGSKALSTDDVWDQLRQLRASRARGMSKEYLNSCLIKAPCLILATSA